MTKIYRHLYITLLMLCCTGCFESDKVLVLSNLPITEPKRDINVALVLPLTGPKSNTGKNLLDSALLALNDLKNPNLHVTTIDSNSSQEKIKAKLDKFKTNLIIGPVYGTDVQKLIPYAKEKNLCMITFSNDATIATNSSCTLLFGVMPYQSIATIANYTRGKGYNHIVAILPKNKYGEAIANHVDKKSIEIIGFYETENEYTKNHEINEIIKTLKSEYPEQNKTAILIPDNKEVANIANLLSKDLTSRYKLIGGGLWEDETLYNDPLLNGSWFAAPPKNLRSQFDKRFASKYDYKPQKIDSLGYDAICLAALLLEENPVISFDYFTRPEGFKGITSAFRFLPDGTNIRELSIYEIIESKAKEIEAANDVFK